MVYVSSSLYMYHGYYGYIEEFTSYVCSCFIEFITRVKEKKLNARIAEHFISFSQLVLLNQ